MALRDPVAAATHLMMGVAALFATALLLRVSRGDPYRRSLLAVFSGSMVLLYFASGTYHTVPRDHPALDTFRRLDHSAIYVLIAGTYTPVFGILLPRPMGRAMLVGMWTLAALGVAGKWLLPWLPHPVAVGLYLAMGWLGLLPLPAIWRAVGPRGMAWALLGGGLYTLGAVCELTQWPVVVPGVFGYHEALHVCDLLATAVHCGFIGRYAWPYRAA